MNDTQPEFIEFPKMPRLSRDCLITEKIDGTNAQVLITPEGTIHAGSRTRWITPQNDNFGFARWVEDHREELLQLGPGRHFGEWWGSGIQRRYGLTEKRWSLFNVQRWCLWNEEPAAIPTADPRVIKMRERLPQCCHLVPVLYRGLFSTVAAMEAIEELEYSGSKAAPGFADPEGIVVFHIAGNVGFKKTITEDGIPKALSK